MNANETHNHRNDIVSVAASLSSAPALLLASSLAFICFVVRPVEVAITLLTGTLSKVVFSECNKDF